MFTLEDLTLLMCLFNSLFIIMVTIFWVKEHYFICSVEEWNKLAEVYNKVVENGLIDCLDELVPPGVEACGGYGFFKDQVDEEFYEEEEQEEEGKNKRKKK